MNEGYAWGGKDNLFYYNISNGAVVGGIKVTKDGLFEAGLDYRRQWVYIDVESARRAVEETKYNELKSWDIRCKEIVNKNLTQPDVTEKTKKFWEIWK